MGGMPICVGVLAVGLSFGSCGGSTSSAQLRDTPVCGYSVVNSYPHDPTAYTQGLVMEDGELFEGTGLSGQSSIRRVDLETGTVLQMFSLPASYFGEGITVFGSRLLQLTWLNNIGFIYDKATFELLDTFAYGHPGWGLTDDGHRLVVSTGTPILRFWDPETFVETSQLEVHDDLGPVDHLNELEFIRGEILANVWGSDRIVRIRPDSGEVIAWIDLAGILDPYPPTADVLNGIAFDEDQGRLFVTGKNWPTLFEIELTGCEDLPLFADGFAGGSAAAWSAQLPTR
jgi:glutamine cyclotransferase